MTQPDSTPSVLLDRVSSLINQKMDEQASVVDTFASLLYRNISQDDLRQRSDSDLYGAVLSLWNLLNQRKPQQTLVRVFNPELARHGWQSTHSIVELIVEDMPFLVDSLRMALNRSGLTAHLLLHTPLSLSRDEKGRVHDISGRRRKQAQERVTVFLVEIDRLSDEALIDKLTRELRSVIEEVSVAVGDWQKMRDKLEVVTQDVASLKLPATVSDLERNETLEFLNWLAHDNFTLMGYRKYEVVPVEGDLELQPEDDTSLGLMKRSTGQPGRLLSQLPDTARKEALRPSLLILTKTNAQSRVHRRAHIDYIGIKTFDERGRVNGEHRFIGLYASSFYNRSAINIPLIGPKIERVLQSSEFSQTSHAYKALQNILETYPRDELLQATEQQLLNTCLGVLQMQERDMTRLFMRRDVFGRFFSCMVYVPRERYNTLLRQRTQKVLADILGSDNDVEFTTWFSESALARTHYIVRVENNNLDVDVKFIEPNLIEAARSWEDKLVSALVNTFGEERGKHLQRRYSQAFPSSYQEDILPTTAVVDIEQLEQLSERHQLGMIFFQPQEERLAGNQVRLKLYHREKPIHLSDVLPMLENFGLRVINERPYQLRTADDKVFWILDFGMTYKHDDIDLERSQTRFQEAFSAAWSGHLEDDGFNRLVLAANLSGREASVLRAYAKYMRQIGTSFSERYIEQTLADYPGIASLLFKVFNRKFSPHLKPSHQATNKLRQEVITKLDQVENLDDDRIIRRYVELIDATVRTNFFQGNGQGEGKEYVSFKLEPCRLTEMPLPLPRYEIFVYSPRVEGVHLRGGKVARGGLRWSDRREDFRTEVLGLVKAQQVKNTVIVPVGAKGGFVGKRLHPQLTRDRWLAEGLACYRIFIRGLLDVTDNIVHGKVVPPTDVVRHDDDDTYLVVAADKGTATFSDIANAISEEYGFWLGDAFASGGSVGYDHKKMGITARGAWESVKRHFREIGIDCQTTPFTCVGIGDMAGDVFGNGMLLSSQIKLVAAFNHLHIFIDPDPDPATSYAERQRLFDNPSLNWADYQTELISKGGGIFSRRAKSIKLSAELKKMLGTQKTSLTPNELIQALLQLEVDLLWNGGIGTYVKASSETHLEVGDRANDAVRINGTQLRARIVGEGGNLGMTQLGRIEYATNGGRLNTDFIDNVGGVDCSDNEVNIKILLNQLVDDGELTVKQRNQMLYEMTDDVAALVLDDCYLQTGSISVTELYSHQQLKELIRFMQSLERSDKLDRALEFLPTDEELAERHANGQGLTRPELGVLTAYAKMVLKEQLQETDLPADPWYQGLLLDAVPTPLQQRFQAQLAQHPLRNELIATQLANQLVNEMGINFVSRAQDETGASLAEIVECYTLARGTFAAGDLLKQINALDNRVPAQLQYDMADRLRRQLRRATRWFMRHRDRSQTIEQAIATFRPALDTIAANLYDYMEPAEVESLKQFAASLAAQGVGEELAAWFSNLSTLFSVFDIIQLADKLSRPVPLVAELYFKLGNRMELHWFLRQINQQPVSNHWQAMARAAYREELDWQQRELTGIILAQAGEITDMEQLLHSWQQSRDSELSRWRHLLADFKSGTTHEFAKFSVALRELALLCHRCQSPS